MPPVNDLPGRPLRVIAVRSAELLEAHLPAWRRLVELALDRNPFFEPPMLLAAMRAFCSQRAEVALVYAPQRQHPDAEPVLCGLFPLRTYRGRGVAMGIWTHSFAFTGTPLIRRDFATDTLHAMLDWLRDERAVRTCRFSKLPVDSPVHRALWSVIQRRELSYWIEDQHLRARFERAADAEAFRQRAVPRDVRRGIARSRRQLGEQGVVGTRVLGPGDDPAPWLERFLGIEASGWKARAGTALQQNNEQRTFVFEALTALHANAELAMLELTVDGQAVAMNSALLCGDGGYYFKIAHDERWQRYSPGAVLELEFADWLHTSTDVAWLDSCADPNHPMIDRVWDGRRLIQTFWLATGRRFGKSLLTMLPMLRGVKRSLKTAR